MRPIQYRRPAIMPFRFRWNGWIALAVAAGGLPALKNTQGGVSNMPKEFGTAEAETIVFRTPAEAGLRELMAISKVAYPLQQKRD